MSFVVFGDFVFAVSEFIKLKRKIFIKIYVLCDKAKELLLHFYPSLDGSLFVIPRYELFPCKNMGNLFPAIGDEWEIIVSGRISPSKNISLILHTISYLQTQFNEKVRLKIIGEFDDEENLANFDRPYEGKFKTEIISLIQNLKWVHRPEIIHGETATSWLNHLKPQSVLMALSTNWAEDFGVSLAQAQELGQALIISNIGGHRDICGENIIKIPAHLIVKEQLSVLLDNWTMDRIRVQAIAKYIHQRIMSQVNFKKCGDANFRALDLELLKDDVRRLNSSGIPVQHSFKEYYFGNKINYRKFWREYYNIWAPKVSTSLLIMLSPRAFSWKSVTHTLEAILSYWMNFQDEFQSVAFTHSQSDRYRRHLTKQLKDVVFIGFYDEEINNAKMIRSFLPDAKFHIYLLEQPSLLFYRWRKNTEFNFLNIKDNLIINSLEDLELSKLIFENGHFQRCHFYSSSRFAINKSERLDGPRLLYAGRISEQKGIHFLIWSLYLLSQKQDCPIFEIVGSADDGGSPHLGIPSYEYLTFLHWLISKLGLEEKIIFREELEHRDLLKEFSQREIILVSASVHSDENFGLALSEGLMTGLSAVVSSWGGHRRLEKDFSGQVHSFAVHYNDKTFQLSPVDIASALEKALKNYSRRKLNFNFPPHLEDLGDEQIQADPITETIFCKNFIEKKKSMRSYQKSNQVFDVDLDLGIVNSIRSIYGAKYVPWTGNKVGTSYFVTPWVTFTNEKIFVDDPLIGRKVFLRIGDRKRSAFDTIYSEMLLLSDEELLFLGDLGQIYIF